ncbi:Glycosyl transferase [Sphingobium herbicidovorans NBRC 16415]|uniref:Glycosyl transferase n=1 Tax=Sphingobium herbicidovorans (strain ATCC 700291 / DSM 11019 / CCUG 56400 / KCTC 2939 / LMG 18315 / NBRC 16415 / MH) TaxID=1219045 RepID=A0A086PED5_SPHHM|nr:glycosyltransferase family 2 protein [Sphingobium herbicidovorans]KFG91753.1 Glycosyl transferase [Sphingobium herbicidovorans NBRC 16415]
MGISFIITTYNVAPYVRQCLDSLAACARPGDQVILVDDGSTDETADRVQEFFREGGFPEAVQWTPVWLGTNTYGGVGIAGNIGLDHAERDTVFFIDGDDYLIPDAFDRARRDYDRDRSDIFLTNYDEFDEKNQSLKRPADSHRWPTLESSSPGEPRRIAALAMIAVPWRKFYRRSMLVDKKIRFPEGDFFFEDNPFHWDVCLAAQSIGFSNHIVCHHRINRPGQTMASTGIELTAFFRHFETIWNAIPTSQTEYQLQAVRWLIGNMSWQLSRLHPEALNMYVTAASEALEKINPSIWMHNALQSLRGSNAWRYANRIRSGKEWDVIEALHTSRSVRLQEELSDRLNALEKNTKVQNAHIKTIRETIQARKSADEYQSIRSIFNK